MDIESPLFARPDNHSNLTFPVKSEPVVGDLRVAVEADAAPDFSVAGSGRAVARLVKDSFDDSYFRAMEFNDDDDGTADASAPSADTAHPASETHAPPPSNAPPSESAHPFSTKTSTPSAATPIVSNTGTATLSADLISMTPSADAPKLSTHVPLPPLQHQVLSPFRSGRIRTTSSTASQNTPTTPTTTTTNSKPPPDAVATPRTANRTVPHRHQDDGNEHGIEHNLPHVSSSANPSSQPGSPGSTESGFMNRILNGDSSISEGSFGGQHQQQPQQQSISRTPPTQLATSYENSHFAKRQRAGSVSERLRSAAELEEKGMIDREQKAIMKDLLISGDDQLQVAIDKYDEGDHSMLQDIINSGALSNAATQDIDLFGDLDLDNMTMGDTLDGQVAEQLQGSTATVNGPAAMSVGSAPALPVSRGTGHSVANVPSSSSVAAAGAASSTLDTPGTVTPHVDSDGIGEMDFGPDMGPTAADFLSIANGTRSRSESLFSLDPSLAGLRSRSNSTWSIEQGRNRARSNSLFSALIGVASQQQEQEHYGKWMETPKKEDTGDDNERMEDSSEDDDVDLGVGDGVAMSKADEKYVDDMQQTRQRKKSLDAMDIVSRKISPAKKGKKSGTSVPTAGRRSGVNNGVAPKKRAVGRPPKEMSNLSRLMKKQDEIKYGFDTTGMTVREMKAEHKRREKEEKKRIRQEKKEMKERMKQDKDKKRRDKKEQQKEEEREEHVPGSGRPHPLSDPNLVSKIGEDGLLHVERPKDWVGAYSPESRKIRIQKFLEKRNHRVWTKTVKYDVRKNFADSRLRVKGRFVKKEDELMMRELMSLT